MTKKKHKIYFHTISKIIIVTIVFTATIGLVGCNKKNSGETETTKTTDVKKDVIPKGIAVEGINVGEMTQEEAKKFLVDKLTINENDNLIGLKSEDGQYVYSYTYADFGAKYDIDKAVLEAYNGKKDAGTYAAFIYDKELIKNKVKDIGKALDIKPINASAKRENGRFVVSPSKYGQEVEESVIVEGIINALDNRDFGKTVDFKIKEKLPSVVESDFDKVSSVIGSFKSPYKGGSDNRITNLKNGCLKINDVVVYPGEVFSTNAHFNPCTYENGWRSAATIVNGKIEDSIGGGMCQVSSALYDAVLNAELEVVERHNHSLKVAYADYGYDATLAGDYKDLKFKNNTDYPIYIESYLGGNNVIVNIYGYEIHPASRTITFKNKFISSNEPEAPLVTNDPKLPEGSEKTTTSALKGQKYELYKYVYENNILVDTVLINTSTYKARRAEISKGTGAKVAEPAMAVETQTQDTSNQQGSTAIIDAPVVDVIPEDVIVEETIGNIIQEEIIQ